MIVVELVYNLSVLVALSVFSNFLTARFRRDGRTGQVLQGLLFGGIAIVGMIYPFVLEKGVIFDGRSIVISLCTLFFGPVSGIISSVLAAAYRIFLGGGGAVMGVLTITFSFLVGWFFFRRRQRTDHRQLRTIDLYILGIIVHAGMTAFLLTLPSGLTAEAFRLVGFTIMGVYPLISVLIGTILLDQEENQSNLQRLVEREELFRTTLYSIGDGVITTDTQGRVRHMNPVAEQLTGWTEQEAQGAESRVVFNIISEVNRQPVDSPIQKVLERGTVAGLANHTLLVSRNGREYPIADRGAPIRSERGEIVGVVLVFRDQTPERESERRLRESEARLRRAEVVARWGNWELDLATMTINASEGATRIYGFQSTMTGLPAVQSVVLPEYRPMLDAALRRLVERGEPYDVHFRIKRSDTGALIDVHSVAQYDPDRKRVFGVVQDVTDRVRAESAVRESQFFLSNLLEAIPVPVFYKDTDGRYLGCNNSFVGFTGVSREQLIGRPVHDVYRADLADTYLAKDRELLEQGGVQVYETKLPNAAGALRDVFLHKATFRNAEGSVAGLIGAFIDVTEQKRSQREQLRLLNIIENSLNEIYIFDAETLRFEYVNQGALRNIGFTLEEMMRRTPVDIKPEFTPERFRELVRPLLLHERETLVFETIHRRKDGSDYPVEVHLQCSEDTGQRTFLAFINDITERKRLEGQLLQGQKLDSVGTLASGVAHDFNNILGIIMGHAALLEHRRDDPRKLTDSIQTILKSAERGAAVVKQLLTFARKAESRRQSMNLNDIVMEVNQFISETFPKTITISTRIDPDLPAVLADTGQIHQVLMNLCVNARDAMPRGGTLSVMTRRVPVEEVRRQFPGVRLQGYVALVVSDTGVGMDGRTRQRIFEPFFTTKEVGRGTGLGLAVVHGVVTAHGGFVDVSSEPGKGTSFTAYLPAHDQPETSGTQPDRTTSAVPGGTEAVLVIEDEEMLRDLLCSALETQGYAVLTAEDGRRGVEQFREHRGMIGAVLCDMGLPRMGGEEVFERIREIDPAAAIILASGFFDPAAKSRLEGLGARQFLQKPYRPTDVLRVLRQTLDARK